MNGSIPPRKFLESVDLLLTDDAAELAKTNPDASRLLAEENPTALSATAFKGLFQDHSGCDSAFFATITGSLTSSNSKFGARA